jgi:hypothetical protein
VQRQIDAGFSADRIAAVQARICAAGIPERLKPEGREEARGYRDTAEAMIAAHRQATTLQAGTEDERGHGLAIVSPLASASGTEAEPGGTTTWVTRALRDRIDRAARQAGPNSKPGPNPPPARSTTTMTEPETNPDNPQRRRDAARETVRREAFRLARDSGAAIVARPMFRGDTEPTVRDVEPLNGARAARDLELAARRTAREYIRQAREAGHGWEQIGRSLGIAPNADADQAGPPAAEAAYTYAAGSPRTDTAVRYGRSFVWRCRSCDQAISDCGLIAGPADDELGHTSNCPRLAAAVAEWEAEP